MRLLVLDHFFRQDIEALRAAAPAAGCEIRTVDYRPLRAEALRIFPADIASGLEPMARPEYEPYRARYRERLVEILAALRRRWRFDALVSPSDLFFYMRDAREAAHAVGVPFFVVQKETTVAPGTMGEHADAVRRYAPPLVDHMTVCSERQGEFWLRAGAPGEAITVTGQPRFDFYRHPERWPARGPGTPPTALFFSYHVDAYHPSGAEGDHGESAWAALHRQTEEGLWRLARAGWRVLVKPHPQQAFAIERERIRRTTAGLDVRLLSPAADARKLIVTSDVVVGFQTTALFEALMARRPVVYTGWDPEARRLAGELIGFHEWADVLTVADDPDMLPALVEAARGGTPDAASEPRIDAMVAGHLGPVDGRAAERALETLGAHERPFRADGCARAAAATIPARPALRARWRVLEARGRLGARVLAARETLRPRETAPWRR